MNHCFQAKICGDGEACVAVRYRHCDECNPYPVCVGEFSFRVQLPGDKRLSSLSLVFVFQLLVAPLDLNHPMSMRSTELQAAQRRRS